MLCKGQVIVKGTVLDSLLQPLSYANVYAQEADNTAIIAFAATDEQGRFTLDVPSAKSIIIKASLLGYATKERFLKAGETIPETIRFVLPQQTFELKEAVITASGSVIEKPDTVTFRADAYRDSTERNLEELLVKLPGVSVDENTGTISVRGQPIKKILIEGDDLTGRNYQLISKNLNAEVIDKIQIIDKFDENRLLRGLRRSDDKVINITLKEDKKKLLFGNAVVSLGNDSRTNNSLNLFSFYNKFKVLTFGNFNTIGQKSDADRMAGNDFGEDTEAQRQSALLKNDNNSFINIDRAPDVDIGTQNTRFNRAALLSSLFAVRPTENVSLKAGITFANDRQRMFIDNEWRYRLTDSIFTLSEQNEWLRRPEVWQGRLETLWDVSATSSLRYFTQIQNTTVKDEALTISNQNNVNNQLNNNNFFWQHILDYTIRLNDHHALLLNASYIKNNSVQDFGFTQTQTRLLPFSPQTFSTLAQHIENPMQFWSANAQLLHSKNGRKISFNTGFVQKEQLLQSALNLTDTLNEALPIPAVFKNDETFVQTNYYGNINTSLRRGSTDFFMDLSGGYFKLKRSQAFLLQENTKANFYILPVVGFKREKNKNAIFGTYAYNIALPQLADLSTGYTVTDYRTLQRGNSLFIPANSHTTILNLTQGEFSDDFMFYTNIIGTITNKGYRNDWNINTDFNIIDKVENQFQNKNLIWSAGFEYYSSALYARFKFRPRVAFSTFQNTLNNGALRNANSVTNTLDFTVRSAFLKWFNYHLGTTLTFSNVNTSVGDVNTVARNQSIGSFLDFYFQFSKRFSARLENEFFYFKQSAALAQDYTFFNASARYELIPAKLSLSLTARNLSNNRTFINSFVTDLSTNINQVRLLPRYILVEVNFRF